MFSTPKSGERRAEVARLCLESLRDRLDHSRVQEVAVVMETAKAVAGLLKSFLTVRLRCVGSASEDELRRSAFPSSVEGQACSFSDLR